MIFNQRITVYPWCYYHNELITKYSSNLQKATIAGQKENIENYRRSEIRWIEHNSESDWIYEKLANIAVAASRDFLRVNITGFEEPLQFTQYLGSKENGGHYDWHIDYGSDALSVRKLSLVTLLSDETKFVGGELHMYGSGKIEQLKRGSVVCFPSYRLHKVTPVTEGVRYSLVAWVSGPPWM
jgi:PKHD-type hydroxylase